MGLYCFPSPRDGVLPVLVIYTVASVALLKNILRFLLVLMGAAPNSQEDSANENIETSTRTRRVSITRYGSLCKNRCKYCCNIDRISSGINGGTCACSGNGHTHLWPLMECCVCLCRFEADEEVSELSCNHFFHKICLEKWFDNQHTTTCPLCRSVL